MKISNCIRANALEKLGVTGVIAKLFMSKDSEDFLIAWELIEDHPNCKYIRVYCKGKTSEIPELRGYFDKEAGMYYNLENGQYKFGNIVINI